MRLDVAWERWDDWCTRTAKAPWRFSKHANTPTEDRQRVVDLQEALAAGAAKLGVTPVHLRALILAQKRQGYTTAEAVAAVVERLRRGQGQGG